MKINLKNIIQDENSDFRIVVSRDFMKDYGIKWLIDRCERGATGGVRGLIDKENYNNSQLNIGVVLFWAQAYANYIKKYFPSKKRKIFLGFDTRYHSALFAKVISRVFIINGIEVFRDKDEQQPTATAAISYLVSFHKLCGGVIITASHNPANQNGIKTVNFYGGLDTDDVSEKILNEIRSLSKKGTIFVGRLNNKPEIIYTDASKDYYENYIKKIFLKEDKFIVKEALNQNWRFVIDGIGGTGGATMEYFLDKIFPDFPWQSQIKIINKTHDPSMLGIYFPDPTNPNVLKESGLIAEMEKLKAEIGGTGDADWDRFGLVVSLRKEQKEQARKFGLHVSETSGFPIVRFQPDQLFTLLSYFRVDQLIRKGRAISNCYCFSTFASSHLAEELADFFKIKIGYSSVGFKYLGRLIYKLEKLAKIKKEVVLINAQEESGGNQVGYLEGLDKEGELGNKNKDASTLLFLLMSLSAELFLQNKNLVDFYFEMINALKVIHFYERLDIYLPKPDFNNQISEEIKLGEERERAKLADSLENNPETVARLLDSELSSNKPREYFLRKGKLFEKVDTKGKVIWRRIYRKKGEATSFSTKGSWREVSIKVKNYSLSNGSSFSIFHIGEGPRIELYGKDGRLLSWIAFRPSGTEAGLFRIYVEILDRDINNPDVFAMIKFAVPFLKYLRLDSVVTELEEMLESKYKKINQY